LILDTFFIESKKEKKKMVAEKFMGLGKKDAQNLAEAHNLIFRLIRVDDRNIFGYPEDSRDDRICVEIDQGKVSKAVVQ
jgi:hypothetical protein